MKKIQDHYFKKAKKEGFPARSVYKLVEAQQKFGLLKKGDRILDLGCQPGSWAIYASQISGPSGHVVGIDCNKGKAVVQPGGSAIITLCGDIMTMPGLPKVPASERIDIDDHGVITGLF